MMPVQRNITSLYKNVKLHKPRWLCKHSLNNTCVRKYAKGSLRDVVDRILKKNAKDGVKKGDSCDKCENIHPHNVKVVIIGGGMIPIYTAVLLKQYQSIKAIHVVDVNNSTSSAVLDANQIDTSTRIKYYKREHLKDALKDTDVVALMDANDEFASGDIPARFAAATSAGLRALTEEIVAFVPEVPLAVFARPVTATLPLVTAIYESAKRSHPGRMVVLGSTAIACMRVEALTAAYLGLDPTFLSVPLLGGGDPAVIVPLYSRATPVSQFTAEEERMLINTFQCMDKELANSERKGPTLSAAAAAANFILTLITGLHGTKPVTIYAFVKSTALPGCKFFTSELRLGTNGVEENCGLPKLSPTELLMIEQVMPFIKEYTEMGMSAACDKSC